MAGFINNFENLNSLMGVPMLKIMENFWYIVFGYKFISTVIGTRWTRFRQKISPKIKNTTAMNFGKF
jgi:hypothetical protein